MSVAEKLKALEFDLANIFNNSTSLLALTDALPQIVVVVEAAEALDSFRDAPLGRALAALDEALT